MQQMQQILSSKVGPIPVWMIILVIAGYLWWR